MTRGPLIFLLVLSFLFNIFFVMGAMTWRGEETQQTAASVDSVIRKLDLDQRQAEVFRSLYSDFKLQSAVIGEDLSRIRRSIGRQLEQDTPDINRLRELAAEETALRAERHEIAGDQFTHFVDLLNPAQRRTLGHRLMGSPRPPRPPVGEFERRELAIFDQDGDGSLNPEEREEARRFHRHRMEMRRQHRLQEERRFDANGDGRLSLEEQAAYRDFLLNLPDRPPRDFGPAGRPPHEHRPPPPGF